MNEQRREEAPYVPATKRIPEATILALLLGSGLSILMGAANTYLGLYAGMTVSASIPAAVTSMVFLRLVFGRGTILENNIVQTMASTGESLAAGVIFTVPALVMVGVWKEFEFWPTTLIVLLGGLLGIVFMVPMRRALIVRRRDLIYPEGVACSEVLQTGESGGKGLRAILLGSVVGAVFKILISGVHLVQGTVEGAVTRGRSVLYMGADMSVALLAVGYIVNLNIAVLITLGGAIGWLVAMPLLGGADPGAVALDTAWDLWETKIRYLGVGAMLVGGLHSIWSVRGGIVAGITGLRPARDTETGLQPEACLRTERDMPFPWLLGVFLITTLATFFLYDYLIGSAGIALVTTIVMVIAAFLFVAVATYIAGLVGSSNSPVSGMTICALLIAAGALLALGIKGESAILATLGVAGVVCCATCTSGDIAQDLKTGLLVGATPAKQQWTEIVATVVSACAFAPILFLLHGAYGIGTGEPGSLRAPQAALFASLTEGFFGDGVLPWNLILYGALIGVVLIVVDGFLKRAGSSFRAHVMPIAVGIYLPLSLDIPILAGGLIRHFFGRGDKGSGGSLGILFGSGLIAGEALLGIGLAAPIILVPQLVPDLGSNAIQSLFVFALVVALYVVMARRSSASGGGR
ncbi:OPT family oligopeptide transporter [Candidatus Eisenbacteria bacterium]|uniref:OPT family oligopeptide transporter n=1 Tax=Eiseniibacteriota bacterium TaxID=2212470 RepID=A0ABV6YLJ5_UNCEI